MHRVLVVEPDETARKDLLLALRQRQIEADGVAGASVIGAVLAQGDLRAIVVGAGAGAELGHVLRAGRAAAAGVVALVPDARTGWDAMRAGAADFVPASAGLLDGLALALRKLDARLSYARAHGGRVEAVAPPAERPAGEGGPLAGAGLEREADRALERFVGDNPGVVALRDRVRRFAAVSSAVLIGGESGTGKELIARALHDLSPWRAGPFVPVNCGAIPAGLIESELFGHERGAFTDAVRDKRGLFEVADGGTLFLDEIADLPLGLQAKLLRVLQDGIVRRVGATDEVRVQARVLAASARDLAGEVRGGRFREDFYYRLAGLELHIPPLRARRDDIPRLATHFLARACARLGLSPRTIDPTAMQVLVAYGWPGNARELENTLERAAVLCSDDRVDVSSLPDKVRAAAAVDLDVGPSAGIPVAVVDPASQGAPNLSIKRAVLAIEQDLIRRALAKTRGNRVRAAELLEISHRALLYKIKDYAIEVDSVKRGAGSKAKDDSESPPGGPRARSPG